MAKGHGVVTIIIHIPTLTLRPYQRACIDAVVADWQAGVRDTLVVLPTGAGKTAVFLSLLAEQLALRPAARALILANRQDLVQQTYERIQSYFPTLAPVTGIVMGAMDAVRSQVVIGSVQTLQQPQRLQSLLFYGPLDLLVVDETHLAPSADGWVDVIRTLRQRNPQLLHLGVTATPRSPDGRLRTLYKHCSYAMGIDELIQLGALVPPQWLAVATGVDVSTVPIGRDGEYLATELASLVDAPGCLDLLVSAWQQYAPGRRTLIFTASVAGAHALARRFQVAGVQAIAADSATPRDARKLLLDRFRRGSYQVVTNHSLWCEGIDVPEIDCVVVGRPVRSDVRYQQMIGRGLRPTPGKTDCLIMDLVPMEQRGLTVPADVLAPVVTDAQRELLPTIRARAASVPPGTVLAYPLTYRIT